MTTTNKQIPENIRYIEHGAGGPAEVMHIAQAPCPTPAAGEILIKVAYAGVNRPDVLQRSGKYPPPPGALPWLGLEASGWVAALGEGVSDWQVGDQVCALCNGGAYAEYVCVPAGQALAPPKGLGLDIAAALPETYFTVWANVIERGRLKAGERILIHGGSSGIGMTAIQMAKAWGAEVFTTVGSADKIEAVKAIGADHAINYREADFQEEVARITAKQGVNLILDMVGGPYIDKNLKSLALEGRLVQIAFLQTPKVEIDWTQLMIRRLSFTGSTLRARSAADKQGLAQSLKQHIWPYLERGQMLPSIYAVFDLADAAKAHALMESSQHIGKILLKVAN
ncbi:MAG: NAD(P)H-quinone oxidoreductase [Burkholderiaceae bacterium]|jgi:putative PIG3 family NAD(P)H quinone oxidoreductase|nr:NAD(P)H-quinone oxidoreductase [Betaproteobacteria bacterium]